MEIVGGQYYKTHLPQLTESQDFSAGWTFLPNAICQIRIIIVKMTCLFQTVYLTNNPSINTSL